MAQQLVKYEAARKAIAQARRVDEIKLIIGQAAQLKAAAKIAKDKQLQDDADEIRRRAERRVSDLMAAQARAVGKAKGATAKNTTRGKHAPASSPATLAEAGIDKDLAKRARLLGAIPEPVFEETLKQARRDGVAPTMALMTKVADAVADRELGKPKTKREPKAKPSPLYDPWAQLSRAVRHIADQRQSTLADLARQSRRVGFLDIDLGHARRALDQLSHWHTALVWEASHGATAHEHGNSDAGREGAEASAKPH